MTTGRTDSRSTVVERRRAAQYRVAEILADGDTLDACAPALLAALSEGFDAAFAALWAIDGRELRCVATCEGDAAYNAFAALTREMRFESGVGVPGRIWRSGTPHWIENVFEHDNVPRLEAARQAGLRAAFGFRAQLSGDVLALFEFFNTRILEPDEDIVQLFQGVGRQVAQFIARKRAEDDCAQLSVQAQQARLEAETAIRANDEFIALISHELRTPLNTILGWSSILKNPATKAETRQRAIDAIDRGATTQARLIEDLLDVSRIRRGTLALDCQSIDAAVPVRAAMDVVQATAKERGVSLVAAGLEQSVRVSADKARLRQIVLNLLSNAIKFTPAGGRVTLTLIPKITEVEIEVRDTGVGVRPEFLPHLFEPFRQGSAPAGGAERGLGLGLAIVRHLAHAHGGSVTAASDGEGRGSTFTVTLPRESRKS